MLLTFTMTLMMMMMMITVVSSFTTTTTTRTTTRTITSSLFISKNPDDDDDDFNNNDNKKKKKGSMGRGGGENEEEESEIDFQRRMAVVRSLQMAFYGTPSAVKPTTSTTKTNDNGDDDDDTSDNDDENILQQLQLPEYEISTGTIKRLPLFRASFYELPGRSNVLIIRDPIYTNMFERMFYTASSSSSSSSSTTSTHTTTTTSVTSSSTYNSISNKGTSSSSSSSTNTVLPMMFGHVYMPKENREINNYELSPWNETDYTTTTDDDTDDMASVIGTIMYVRDYRRMKDGKILVLVQASERFVIDYIHQSVPYSIVDVKVIPDIEELQKSNISREKEEELVVGVNENGTTKTKTNNNDEEQFIVDCFQADERVWIGNARNKAIKESIQNYHWYECNPNQKLHGIPTKLDLSFVDITHTALSDVLPYVPFATTTTTTTTTDSVDSVVLFSDNSDDNVKNKEPKSSSSSSVVELVAPSLELQLLSRGITKFPSFDQRFSASLFKSSFSPYKRITTNELEYHCWIVLDYFLLNTNKTISPLLLELLPQQQQFVVDWPDDFTLQEKYDEYNNNDNKNKKDNTTTTTEKKFVNVLPYNYPNLRRQRRFSYSVAYMLESILPIGMTTTTATIGSSNNYNDSNNNEGRYSDNFRNGGRRYSRKKETDDANADADHDSYSDYIVDGDEIQQFRSTLLAIPSTRQRLRFVLEKFYQWKLYL